MTNPDAIAGVVARMEEAIAGASWAEDFDDVPRNVVISKSDAVALLAALAEARKDSERLDWLEKHQGRVSGPAFDNPRWVVWADDAANDVEADNFRDAIDRARRTPQPETPE